MIEIGRRDTQYADKTDIKTYITGAYYNHNDNKSFNPSISEIYSPQNKIKPTIKRYSWKEVLPNPAFYVFAFSDETYYADFTDNMLYDLTYFYNEILSFNASSWRKKVKQEILKRQHQHFKGKGFKYCFCTVVKIFIQYTSSMNIAAALQKDWLYKVEKEGSKGFYPYNIFTGESEIKFDDFNTTDLLMAAQEKYLEKIKLDKRDENFIGN